MGEHGPVAVHTAMPPASMDGTAWTRFPGERSSVPAARAFTTRFLQSQSLTGWTHAFDLLQCVSELVSNALFHSRSGQQGHHLIVHLQVEPGALSATVLDEGEPDDPPPERVCAEGGFGLTLITALCDDYDVRTTPTGHSSRSCRWTIPPAQRATAPAGSRDTYAPRTFLQ
jgi:anti-sigma regulatory factor (Ser/Thr protein kinase)